MKLYIDDIRNPPDDSWTLCRTVSEAIRALAQFNFEEVSLDHDISHQVTVADVSRPFPCEETFQPVAYFIGVAYRYEKTIGFDRNIPKITIHSSNPVGGLEMQNILKGYGIDSELKPMGPAHRTK